MVLPDQVAEATGNDPREVAKLREFYIARDLTQQDRRATVIDFYPQTEQESQRAFPHLFQWLLTRVKPQREQDRVEERRRNWWLFTRPVPPLRRAISDVERYILVPRTAKHFTFHFRSASAVPDTSVVAIASDDAFVLGLLLSRIHRAWALRAGGRLGIGNDPRYQHASTFNPFPFPNATAAQQQRIRDLGEQLDAHRKARQAAHPDLTITGMYNVLEKLRAGAELTDKERDVHERGLVSILKKIHDDLDAAVFDAYGWPTDLTDEEILEKLVALNAERAEEEKKNGYVRWLRPDFQNPSGKTAATQTTMPAGEDQAEEAPAPASVKPWPKNIAQQIAAVRDRVSAPGKVFSVASVAAAFKGAKKKDVEGLLDSLAALGLLTGFDTPAGKRWRAVGKVG